MRKFRFFLRPVTFLLPSLFLIVLFNATPVSAQDTAEVCRETAKVLEQLRRNSTDLVRLKLLKGSERLYRDSLSDLEKAIASGSLIKPSTLTSLARLTKVEIPLTSSGQVKEAVQLTPAERSVLQRSVRSAFHRDLEEAAYTTIDRIEDRVEKNNVQIESRIGRMRSLNCNEVLIRECDGEGEGEDDSTSSGNGACWNGTFKGSDTGGYAMTINLSQGSGSEVTGGWTFLHRGAGKQVNAKIDTATAEGNTLTGRWTQTGVPMDGDFVWQWLAGKECREFEGSFKGTKYWNKMVKQ